MSNINEVSIKILKLDSALRNAKFVSNEAKIIMGELESGKLNEIKQKTIHLFSNIQNLFLDYNYLRGSFDEKEIEEALKSIRKEVTIYLAKYRKGINDFNVEEIKPILKNISNLTKIVTRIMRRIRKKVPKENEFYYAGADGGGTKTIAAISSSDGKILGKGVAGPCFPREYGFIKSFANAIRAIKDATANAGLDVNFVFFKRICIGLAGVDTNFEHRRLNELFMEYMAKQETIKKRMLEKGKEAVMINVGEAIVIQDSLLAWYSAFRGKPGIIAIGGTGDFIYGYNGGRDFHNWVDPHKRGLYNIWRDVNRVQGLSIAFHAACKIKEFVYKNKRTTLTNLWEQAFINGHIFKEYQNKIGFAELLRLIEKSGTPEQVILIKDVADTTKLVFEAAEKGDADALNIIQDAAESTALYISDVAEKIGLHHKNFKVALIGPAIRNLIAKVRLKKALNEIEPYAELTNPELEPREGAIEIARRRDTRFY